MAPSALPTKPLYVPNKKLNRSAIRHSLTLSLDLPERLLEKDYDAVSAALRNRSLTTHSPFPTANLSPWVLTAHFSSHEVSSASVYSGQSFVLSATAADLSFPVSASPTTDSWLTSPVVRGTPQRAKRRGMYLDGNSSDSSSDSSGILSSDKVVFTVQIVTENSLQRSVSENKPQPAQRGWGRALKRWSRPASTNAIPGPAVKKPAGPRPRSERPVAKKQPALATTPVSPTPWKPSAKSKPSLRARRFQSPPDLPLPPVPALPKRFQPANNAEIDKRLQTIGETDSRLNIPGSRSGLILCSR